MAEMIMDPDDRGAFIGMRRSMRGSVRQALRILEKYELPGDEPAGEDLPIPNDKATT